jgi:hypothetical protein
VADTATPSTDKTAPSQSETLAPAPAVAAWIGHVETVAPSSHDLFTLQIYLAQLGLFPDEPTGLADAATWDAVDALARLIGFPPTRDTNEAHIQVRHAREMVNDQRPLADSHFIPPTAPALLLVLLSTRDLEAYSRFVTATFNLPQPRLNETLQAPSRLRITLNTMLTPDVGPWWRKERCRDFDVTFTKGDTIFQVPHARACRTSKAARWVLVPAN